MIRGLILTLGVTLLIAILTPHSYSQTEKPQCILRPLITNEKSFSDVKKDMLFNELESSLSKYYQVTTKAEYKNAYKKLLEELATKEECTVDDDYCIQRIQDNLQVERLFIPKLSKDGNNTQFKLTFVYMDKSQPVTENCKNCDLNQLLDKINGLVLRLIEQDPDFDDYFDKEQPIKGGFKLITPKVSRNTNAKTASLFLTSNPSGVTVHLDGAEAGKTPYQNMFLKPNQLVRITLKHKDYRDKRIKIKLNAGINRPPLIKLQSKYGKLSIKSVPSGATIFLAGVKKGKTPYTNNHILSGSYLLSLRHSHYFPKENIKLNISDAIKTSLNYTLQPNYGNLIVESSPSGAKVKIQNKDKKIIHQLVSPFSQRLTPGIYYMELNKKGYSKLPIRATIVRNKTVHIKKDNAKLRRLEGHLTISSEPYQENADIYIDGRKKAKVPASLTLPVGEYEIMVKTSDKKGIVKLKVKDLSAHNLIIPLKKLNIAKLTINTNIDNPRIIINEKTFNRLIFNQLKPGWYNIIVNDRNDEYFAQEKSVSLEARENRTLYFKLKKKPISNDIDVDVISGEIGARLGGEWEEENIPNESMSTSSQKTEKKSNLINLKNLKYGFLYSPFYFSVAYFGSGREDDSTSVLGQEISFIVADKSNQYRLRIDYFDCENPILGSDCNISKGPLDGEDVEYLYSINNFRGYGFSVDKVFGRSGELFTVGLGFRNVYYQRKVTIVDSQTEDTIASNDEEIQEQLFFGELGFLAWKRSEDLFFGVHWQINLFDPNVSPVMNLFYIGFFF
jgi:hypothetical protein